MRNHFVENGVKVRITSISSGVCLASFLGIEYNTEAKVSLFTALSAVIGAYLNPKLLSGLSEGHLPYIPRCGLA